MARQESTAVSLHDEVCMSRKLLLALTLGLASPLSAQFTNGNFENGTASGWITGGGYRGGITNSGLIPASFLPGGANYNPTANRSAVVGPGIVANTDGNLNRVYSGNYSYRIEDVTDGGYASVISQTVANYQDNNIFFAWAATLESAHGTNDGAVFKLLLRNDTRGIDLISRQYTAASGGGGIDSRFTLSTTGHYYTRDWQIEQLDVSQYLGDTFTLILLAADCQPTAHQGTVYLDGFGAVTPPPVLPPDSGVVPEPATNALMGSGLLMLGGFLRARRRRGIVAVA
jgi:hypothetical protein